VEDPVIRLPTYFISHGGGPWPWMTGPMRGRYATLESSLQSTAREIGPAPAAILMVSGHWEEDRFTAQSGEHPGMVYDYSGFPPEMYRIRYPAPGAPDVARRVRDLLMAAGIDAGLDPNRGYDHGTYAPLYAMYPEATVPVVQLSIKRGYDPGEHLAAGRALAPLRDDNIAIVGSGLSWHNLRMLGPAAHEPSQAFDRWLAETMAAAPEERTDRLRHWDTAPAARVAHPDEDHLIPLMVVVGAAEHETAHRVYYEEYFMGGVTASSYRLGDSAAHG
jgi:aromatic ring-opening dioxygenase catalytic subunit (LigB family)